MCNRVCTTVIGGCFAVAENAACLLTAPRAVMYETTSESVTILEQTILPYPLALAGDYYGI